MSLSSIEATKALFINLGESNTWAPDCLKDGNLRLGYRKIPHKLCEEKQWDEVLKVILAVYSEDRGAATRHLNQIKQFYEASEDTLWITFQSDRLFWCFAKTKIEYLPDGSKIRNVVGSWSDNNIKNEPLLMKNISGKVLATRGFPGTICSAPELPYLLDKLNGRVGQHVTNVQNAFDSLVNTLIPIITKLHPGELEILTDLIFRQAGWNRIGVLGKTEKDIDLDLISSITGERIAVQVKSRSTGAMYSDYKTKFSDMRGYTRFYFVTHTPDKALIGEVELSSDPNYVFWGPMELATFSAKNGLVGWLLDKAT